MGEVGCKQRHVCGARALALAPNSGVDYLLPPQALDRARALRSRSEVRAAPRSRPRARAQWPLPPTGRIRHAWATSPALCSQTPPPLNNSTACFEMDFCAFECAARRLGGASLGMGSCASALTLAKGCSKGRSRTRPEQPMVWGSGCSGKRLAAPGPVALKRAERSHGEMGGIAGGCSSPGHGEEKHGG